MIALVLLFGALVATVTADDLRAWPKWATTTVLAVGGLGLWASGPAKRVRTAGLTLYALYIYIERADQAGAALRGELAQVLDRIQTRPDGQPPYRRVVVIAYSFGSLVALDACFSPTTQPPARIADIDALITVGCPHDMIRAFRPDYATARYWRAEAPARWINVYAPSDVLSSNFRDDPLAGPALVGMPLREHPDGMRLPENVLYRIDGRDTPVDTLDMFLLRGLTLHGGYWNNTDDHAESVFGEIVTATFTGNPSLP